MYSSADNDEILRDRWNIEHLRARQDHFAVNGDIRNLSGDRAGCNDDFLAPELLPSLLAFHFNGLSVQKTGFPPGESDSIILEEEFDA